MSGSDSSNDGLGREDEAAGPREHVERRMTLGGAADHLQPGAAGVAVQQGQALDPQGAGGQVQILALAREKGVSVIVSPYDSATTAHRIISAIKIMPHY